MYHNILYDTFALCHYPNISFSFKSGVETVLSTKGSSEVVCQINFTAKKAEK